MNNNNTKKEEKEVISITKIFLGISSGISFCFMFVAALFFGCEDKPVAMGLSIVAGAIGMTFCNLEKFSRFKGAGFEAELKKAVDEAYATTSTVKELAAELTQVILGIIAGEGRWGGMGLNRKIHWRDQVNDTLKKMNLKEEEIKKTHKLFDQYIAWDHGMVIVTRMQRSASDDIGLELEKTLNKSRDFNSLRMSTPEEFKNIKSLYKIEDKEVDEQIEDLEYFLANKKLRRPDVWKNSGW